MSDPMAVLNALLIPLAAIPGVNTCRIGLEASLTPDDYPIIRLVPSSLAPSSLGAINGPRILSLTVYFGAQLLEATEGCLRSMRSCSGWMRRFGRPCW